jgi:lincosamide nucleotidyltransferase B/F
VSEEGDVPRHAMTPEAHAAFTAALLNRLDPDPDVLGVVLLGSSSGEPPAPDAFSDHDLFVVTRPGAQERFRTDLSWLPNAADLVLSFRETAHGVRALDRTGHLVEFAAFDLDELSLARVNRYSVPLDRADVRARMARVRQETAARTAAPPDARWLAGQFLVELLVGASRYGRGERISAHFRVRVGALQHLLGLVRLLATDDARARLDDLDVSRRIEAVVPDVARDIDAALLLPVPDCARALLAVGRRVAPDLVPPGVPGALEQVLARAEDATRHAR